MLYPVKLQDNITTFDLSNQKLDDEYQVLEKVLPVLGERISQLFALYLSSSTTRVPIGKAGIIAMAQFIGSYNLNTLNLDYRLLGSNNTALLAKALPHSIIQSLYLSGNRIGVEGAIALSQASEFKDSEFEFI